MNTVEVVYTGHKKHITLSLPYMPQERRFEPVNGKLVCAMSSNEALRLIRENPKSFAVMSLEVTPQPTDTDDAPDAPNEEDLLDPKSMHVKTLRRLVAKKLQTDINALPTKKADLLDLIGE